MKTTVANGLWQSRYLIFLVCYLLVQVQGSHSNSPRKTIGKSNTYPPEVRGLIDDYSTNYMINITQKLETCESEKVNIEARYDTLFQITILLFMIIFAMVIYFTFIISNNNVNEKLPSQFPSESENTKKNLPLKVKCTSEDLVLQVKEISPDIMRRSSLNMSSYNNILNKHFRKSTPGNSPSKTNLKKNL
jgi:hypothetical protein